MVVERKRAVIIGAGPSGLVSAKYLLESANPSYDVTILEEQHPENNASGIGGSFVNKVYDGTRLVSSKYITAFSDFRMVECNSSADKAISIHDNKRKNGKNRGKDTTKVYDENSYPITYTNHPSAEDYVKYLNAYALKFKISERIKFGCKVISVKAVQSEQQQTGNIGEEDDLDEKGYIVQYEISNKKIVSEHFDIVSVCSGLHNVPNIPEGIESMRKSFHGKIIHSSQYKENSIFDNKRVLILGSGETAMDIALRAIQNCKSKSVALNVRNGFLSIPHNLTEDRPLDVFITNLFEHSYEHPWVHELRLRWTLSTIVIRFFLFLTGSSFGFNQWACETTPIKRGFHIINKSHGAMSHLNVPIKSKTLWGRFWMKVYGEEGLRPIESFHRTSVSSIGEDGRKIYFDDGRFYEADIIILATGYKQYFPFLDDLIREEHRIESNVKASNLKTDFREDYLPSEHFITSKRRPRLGFIGFVRPNVGAIPPMSELQVMWWLCRMNGQINMLESKPGKQRSYMLLGSKYQYGVDYGNYLHRVAEDFGAAPTLSHLFTNSARPFRALFTYCMGQSHIPLFRLRGPFESPICWSIVTEELWNVCLKRGFGENFGLISICFVSFWMNITACIFELLWCIFTIRKPKFFARY